MNYGIPTVMDASKLGFFTRAAAVRFGSLSTAGALEGLGVAQLQLAKNGACPAGFHAGPPGFQGRRYCLPDEAEPWVMPEMTIEGRMPEETGEKKYTVSYTEDAKQMLIDGRGMPAPRGRTAEEVARYLATGSFEKTATPGELFGIPTWVFLAGGALVGVVALVAIVKK